MVQLLLAADNVTMNHISVSSSNVKSIGYENGALEVIFLKGGVYQYYGVPESLYKTLMSGVSIGRYLAANVYGKYTENKIS
jgi:hypothetical protein